ncbi:MAG: acyl carrier protein [Kiritimatiellia bacterium]
MQDFLDQVAEVLEVPSVALADDFRTVPYWSSLTGFALIVMMAQRYGRTVSADELRAARTVADLARLAGVAA